MDRSYYKDFVAQVVYSTRYLDANLGFSHQFSSSMNMGIGASFTSNWEEPRVDPVYNIQKSNLFWGAFLFLNRNTLDRKHYPKKGMEMYVKAAWIFAQNASLDSLTSDLGKQPVELGDYFRFDGKASFYKPLSTLSNLRIGLQYNMNLEPRNSYLDDWRVGGLTDFLHNQVGFAGLMENQISTQSVAVLDANYRYQLTSGLFINTTANVALHSFLGNDEPVNAGDNFISGYGLGVSYDSPIGPLELSVMYCDQAKNLYSYINLGFHF
jgi:NTE family protein